MPKRGRSGDQLTGGTGDVNPQWLNIISSANIGTSFATTTVPTPINKFPEGSGRVVIMEILKVMFFPGALVTPTTNSNLQMYLTTKNFASTVPTNGFAEGSLIAGVMFTYNFATSGSSNTNWPMVVDLTDGSGHGMLVATDNLYLGIIQSGANEPMTAATVKVKVLYRFKKVALQEYIGIVQAQQS